jgi:uncharacterized membrane protein YccC
MRSADPGLVSLESAVRAAVVLPAVFLVADKVIQQPQTTIVAGFGSFGLLVLTDFSGPWRPRLVAYLALAGAGAMLISLGTLCSQSPALGAAVMAVVAFAILYSGVISRYVAAGAFPALLTFILAVNVPAPASAISDRLEGWALACAVGIPVLMLVWPSRPRAEVPAAASQAATAIADLLEAELSGNPQLAEARATAAEAVETLRRRYAATLDAAGATGSAEALAFLVDELEWLYSVALAREPGERLRVDQNREAVAEVAAALRASAARLDGGDERPALEQLARAREAVTEALLRELGELPAAPSEADLLATLEPSLRARELAGAGWQVGASALLATTPSAAGLQELRATSPSTSRAVEALAADHAGPRSVSFRNNVRGAVGLAVAIFVAKEASLQDAFWVALGTLSVLRTNALDTGSTVLRALAGTAVGILVGVAVILAIRTDETVLWIVLPLAVLFAAYAPRAISFEAGQAGFTVTVLILFDIVQPSGWTVGLVRVEDVAIGVAISLVVGLLFWPRGAGAVLRTGLADAFARSAEYVAAAVRALALGDSGQQAVERARIAARAATHRLDDAFRQFSGERRADREHLDEFGTLIAGATRLRLAAYSLGQVAEASDGAYHPGRGGGVLDREADGLRSWYVGLGEALARSAPPPRPQVGAAEESRRRVLRHLREALGDGDGLRAALGLVLASQHLVALQSLEAHLADVAGQLNTQAPESVFRRRFRLARARLAAG